ncbi:MAG TPA: hypothetical protein VF177_01335 [Anaerolineae bacterium]
MAENELIIFDGIDLATGQPKISPISPVTAGRNILRRSPAHIAFEPLVKEKKVVVKPGLPQAWGLVCRPDLDPDILTSVKSLIEHRRGTLYPYNGEWDVLSWEESLEQTGVPLADPNMYLLLVGSPKEIPYDFEKLLTPQHAVGRLDLPDAAAYENYVQTLLAYEQDERATKIRRQAVEFFAPDDTQATEVSVRQLVQPLAQAVRNLDSAALDVGTWLGSQATREHLLTQMQSYSSAGAPAVVFLASHGAEVSLDLREHFQGSWIPQGAAALGHDPNEEEAKSCYLTGYDFAGGDLSPYGSIVFNFSCFGAGLHQEFTLRQWVMADEIVPDDPHPLVSALGRNLLANPRPALAYISTLDRTGNIFSWPGGSILFEKCMNFLLEGQTVGEACQFLWSKAGTFRESADQLLERAILAGHSPETMPDDQAQKLALNWWMAGVLNNFVILGDPATRLS